VLNFERKEDGTIAALHLTELDLERLLLLPSATVSYRRLVIAKLDRLSRNLAFVATLMESGVEFVAVDNPYANKLTIHILAAVAEHEREAISERTKAALAAAKARGKRLGTPGTLPVRLDACAWPARRRRRNLQPTSYRSFAKSRPPVIQASTPSPVNSTLGRSPPPTVVYRHVSDVLLSRCMGICAAR
jgi:hypothetical protein